MLAKFVHDSFVMLRNPFQQILEVGSRFYIDGWNLILAVNMFQHRIDAWLHPVKVFCLQLLSSSLSPQPLGRPEDKQTWFLLAVFTWSFQNDAHQTMPGKSAWIKRRRMSLCLSTDFTQSCREQTPPKLG